MQEEIKDLIHARRWSELKDAISGRVAPEIGGLLATLDPAERMLLFRALPRDRQSEVFAYLEDPQQTELLKNLTNEDARRILAELTPDDRTALLEELPAEVTQRLMTLLNPEDLKEARTLLGYPEESVGRLMTPDAVAIRPAWTIQQALDHIRTHGRDAETVNMIYVVDDRGRLIDDLRLRLILLADPHATVESILDHTY